MSLSPVERRAGLSHPLPPGERILWQVRPAARAMTASVFHLRWVAGYAAAAAAAVAIAAHRAGYPAGQCVAAATLVLPLILIATALLSTIGGMTARATTYTLTNRRLILHVGIAYEMTVSIPLSAVRDAAVRRRRGPGGDIALTVADTGGTGWIALWPHVRLGAFLKPRPMLRALPDVEAACALIGDALTEFNAGGRRVPAAPRPAEAVAA